MKTTTLAENTVEALADNRQSLTEFIAALIGEARFQAERAAKEASDYTTEELEYWAIVEFETRPVSATKDGLRSAVGDFLWALDRGYSFVTIEEMKESAFLAALRNKAAV